MHVHTAKGLSSLFVAVEHGGGAWGEHGGAWGEHGGSMGGSMGGELSIGSCSPLAYFVKQIGSMIN